MEQIYSDGTTDISINSGVVRIDFFHYGREKNEDGSAMREHSHRLLMSAEGFLQMYTAADEVIQLLLERGLIQRSARPGAAATPAAAAAPAPATSPNF